MRSLGWALFNMIGVFGRREYLDTDIEMKYHMNMKTAIYKSRSKASGQINLPVP